MGGSKTPKVQPATATSSFGGTTHFGYNLGGLANADSTKQGDTISTTANLDPSLQPLQQNAIAGLGSSQNYLNQSPTQHLQDINAGNNSFYNLQSALNQRNNTQALSSATSRYADNGLDNSTVRGAFEGQLQRDANLQDLATRQNALDYGTQNATATGGYNSQLLGQLAALQQSAGDTSNQNLFQGFQNQDQTSMFNAQQIQQANMANQQAQLAAQQRQSALLGNVVGAGLSLAAAPITGGTSLFGMGLSGLSNLFNGGGAGAPGILNQNLSGSLGGPFGKFAGAGG